PHAARRQHHRAHQGRAQNPPHQIRLLAWRVPRPRPGRGRQPPRPGPRRSRPGAARTARPPGTSYTGAAGPTGSGGAPAGRTPAADNAKSLLMPAACVGLLLLFGSLFFRPFGDVAGVLNTALAPPGPAWPPTFDVQEIETGLGVGYAVLLVDVDGDG